ncbi:nuclear transport factor 2 family protein [Aquincola sp. S2]|uniref:Nuclear transport factor 2 family protein n=1 Tax=Pseudaquabacterium terrae TaxID=2732868 RepID=A0ABX2ELL4_9BURK|nr:nuclear transport factor 2 family protein [Aquabacterium terrae]NRF69544.1 nuclear transport factor 2 family protein [Aquabacterium terrae]
MPRTKPPAVLMTTPDEVEAQFYEALREGDLDKLMALWSDDDEIVCVHPGGPRVIGPRAVRAAFEAIFASGRIVAQPEKVHRVQLMDAAMHNVVERIEIGNPKQGRHVAFVVATNVYHRTTQGWRLVAHHASPGTDVETPEIAEAPSTLH